MTVVQEATGAERVAQALEFLAQAEAEFAMGDNGASVQVIIAASIQRGCDYNSHPANNNATTQLAEEYDDPFLAAGFTAAEKFHIHFHHGGMEDYQITADRYAVRSYVERMVKLVEELEAN
ncbi:MAG: hypothetical protein J4G11_06355 [Acidimicrobiia bacterium]|nr:hypothetical protein [Acidimicrobiia bacterium]